MDAGFTPQGFLASLALQVVSILGALFVALIVYRKTIADERAQFQKQIAHDLEMRRREDAERRNDRDQQASIATHLAFRLALFEIDLNRQAIAEMSEKLDSPMFPLQREALIASMRHFYSPMPRSAADYIMQAIWSIDRYNYTLGRYHYDYVRRIMFDAQEAMDLAHADVFAFVERIWGGLLSTPQERAARSRRGLDHE